MNAKAFAPSHISGFFQPIYHQNIFKTGSRGAGLNLDAGCISEVEIKKGPSQQINIMINEDALSSSVIETAVKKILPQKNVCANIKLTTHLPVSQGFGISAASALSTTLAISSVCNLPRIEAIKAAHFAEVTLKTGLGDVAAANIGGIEIRESPGIPPWGKVHKINQSGKIVICVIDRALSTKQILQNKVLKEKISQVGEQCTDQLLLAPTIDQFFKLSKDFAMQTNLVKKNVLKAINAIEPYGIGSMCMLGNSMFAYGNTDKIEKILSDFGSTTICNIDTKGARIL